MKDIAEQIFTICAYLVNLHSPIVALSTWILTSEMFSDLIVFELVSCVLSVPLNDGIMMYENKDISILPAIQ
jgi:hypothetical protein